MSINLSTVDTQATHYSSDVFGKDFELFDSQRNPGKRLITKLPAVPKSEAQGVLDSLMPQLRGMYSTHFNDDSDFYQNGDHQQIYMLKTNVNGTDRPDLLSVYFRTLHDDKIVNGFLEALQESYMLRTSQADVRSLEKVRQGMFGPEYQASVRNIGVLLEEDREDVSHIPSDSERERYTVRKADMIFDALGVMRDNGYAPNQVLSKTENLLVDPLWGLENDTAFEAVKRSFQ